MTVQPPLPTFTVEDVSIDLLGPEWGTRSSAHPSDSIVLALARYVEALHRRYPEGPDQMRHDALDARANMPRMCKSGRGRAA